MKGKLSNIFGPRGIDTKTALEEAKQCERTLEHNDVDSGTPSSNESGEKNDCSRPKV